MTPEAYDRRILGPFLEQLQRRGNPAYPMAAWHWALAAADRIEPCNGHRDEQPTLGARRVGPAWSHVDKARERFRDYGMREVALASDRWLAKYAKLSLE